MGDAKRIVVKPIAGADARRVITALHYSGKYVNNSQVHLGVFLDGQCGGAMQFGPSLDKRKTQGLVCGTPWNGFLELNRLAFADWLPKNGESRAIGYALRWLRATYPWLQWVISFADATQCGDGTIYRASGFLLTGIKKNNQIWSAPDGSETTTRLVATDTRRPERRALLHRVSMTKGQNVMESGAASMRPFIDAGWKPLAGFQLRYVYFLDPSARDRLTVPVLPYSEIDRLGAGMYRGTPRVRSADNGTEAPTSGGGVIPTRTLQPRKVAAGE